MTEKISVRNGPEKARARTVKIKGAILTRSAKETGPASAVETKGI